MLNINNRYLFRFISTQNLRNLDMGIIIPRKSKVYNIIFTNEMIMHFERTNIFIIIKGVGGSSYNAQATINIELGLI